MATANCTVNGINYFTSSNASGVWGSTSWISPTAAINNKPCFGKFYYSGQYKYRALVLKITTPTYPDNSHTRTLTISVGLRRSTQGSDNWHCAISTTAPSFSNKSSAQIPNNWATTWTNISTSSTYATKTFGTTNFNFKSNTTYYLWMYSDTPTGNNTTGFFSNNYGSAPTISVTTSYSTNTSDTIYCLPTNPVIYGHQGYYHGAYIEIDENASYPHCFVGTSATGIFYHKRLTDSADGRQYFSVDPDTTSTSKTYYIIRTTEAYYQQIAEEQEGLSTEPRLTAPPTAYQVTYNCPRYACLVYCHALEPVFCTNLGGYTLPTFENMEAKGLATLEIATTVDLSFDWTDNGPDLNGGTFYRIYKGTKSSTYYRAGTTANTAETDITFYGKDSILVGATTVNETTCESDISYKLVGWTEDPTNYMPEYTDLNAAIVDGSIIYGVYEKSKTLQYASYALQEDGSKVPRVNTSDPWRSRYYNKGDIIELFYEDVKEPYETYGGTYKINGWSLTGINASPVYRWEELVEASGGTPPSQIYACYTTYNNVFIGNSSWKNVIVCYGLNGEWVPAIIRVGANNKWCGGINTTSTLEKATLGNMILGE